MPAVKPALLYPAVHDDDDVALADQLALEPDQACFYSFDRPTGPRAAEQLFDAAVTAAARVFENRQTEQLVSAEYEFLDRDGNTAVALSKPRRKRRTRQRQPPDLADVPYHNPGLSDDDDDDFELL